MSAFGTLPPLRRAVGAEVLQTITAAAGAKTEALASVAEVSVLNLRRMVETTAAHDTTYKGLSTGQEDTEKMLSHLVTRMRTGGFPWPVSGAGAWTSDDNDAIPSGYTYFAQLVAHDFVQNTVQLPLISAFPGELRRDYRMQRLVLDTIYGGGPAKDPLPYAIAGQGIDERCTFRLGHVRGREPPPFQKQPPEPLMEQPARDIPRAMCPHLSDRPDSRSTPDALVADVRNDTHLIISQMTALFHQLHNAVFAQVRKLQDAPTPERVSQLNLPQRGHYSSEVNFRQAQADMAFLQTRKLVPYIYRRVVVQDFLKRLLEPGVYAAFTDPARALPTEPADQKKAMQIPVEFSHAVFRFGHVMARFSYKLNDQLDLNPSIKNILDRSSPKRRDLLPLASNWLLDWSHFFDLSDNKTLNFARRISPFTANSELSNEGAVPAEKDRIGGLFYVDFMRGYQAHVATVSALIDTLPQADKDRSDLLKDANFREHEIGRWLKMPAGVKFKDEELVSLSKDPPLLFFILFEAAHQQDGRRLGILGSTVVARVFFDALKLNEPEIENDPALPTLADLVFGAAIPSDMPALIKYVKAQGGLKDVVFDPSAGV